MEPLSVARQGRKEADAALHALLARIAFLRSEETKMDIAIQRTRRRTEEALERRARDSVDSDVAETAAQILRTLPHQQAHAMTLAHTGTPSGS